MYAHERGKKIQERYKWPMLPNTTSFKLKVSGTKAELLTRLSDADKLSAGDLPLTASASERLTTAQVVPPSQGASTKKDDAFNDEEGFSFSRPSLITSLYTRAPDDPIGDSFADLPAVEALLLARQQAREARNFKQADKLRAELSAMGVEVRSKKNLSLEFVIVPICAISLLLA
jgi:hypothetical protein